jgi:flagellar assembly protein FliH
VNTQFENALFETTTRPDVVLLTFPEMGEDSGLEFDFEQAERTGREEAAALLTSERDAQWSARLAEERRSAIELAADEWEARLHERVETERSAVAMACASFARTRERYFAEIEGEIVQLALSIAARILHREASMDPTLLTGVVRVALAKLSDPVAAVLHVPSAEIDMWRRAMKSAHLRVEPDEAMSAGELLLRSTAGVVELGIKAQLAEVERGFFDLLAKRPA